MIVEEQENEVSADIVQLISDCNLYEKGKDLLTPLKD